MQELISISRKSMHRNLENCLVPGQTICPCTYGTDWDYNSHQFWPWSLGLMEVGVRHHDLTWYWTSVLQAETGLFHHLLPYSFNWRHEWLNLGLSTKKKKHVLCHWAMIPSQMTNFTLNENSRHVLGDAQSGYKYFILNSLSLFLIKCSQRAPKFLLHPRNVD